MFLALGAASSAIDALKALTSSKSSSAQSTGVSQDAKSPFDLMSSGSSASVGSGSGSGGGGSQISPQTMSALLDAQSQSSAGSTTASKSRSAALKDLFGQIDGDGDGKISKEEFEEALGAGGTNLTQADSVFGKLDKDGDGSVSLKELASALKGGKKHHHERAESSSGDRRIEFRSVLAGPAGRIQHIRHQQRRFGDDVADLCGRIQGNDDVGRGQKLIHISGIVLQFHRADDPASGPGDLIGRHLIAFGQRLNTRPGDDPSDCDLAEAIAPRR